jgi:hypothetical protein
MTSEPDSTPRRRPPTIDLTAKEVETDKPAQAAGGPEAASDRANERGAAGERAAWNLAGRLKPHAIAAALGAVVMAAIIGGLWIAGFGPSRGGTAPPVAQTPVSNAVDEISARLDKIQGALQTRPPDPALANRIATAEAETKSLGDSLAALNRRLDDIAVTARSALAHADAASAAADASKNAAQTNVQRGDLDALANRIASLERAVKSLTDDVARRGSGADDRAARLTIAAEALRAVVERGAPYQSELAALKSLGVDQNALAPLEPFAADGMPSGAALARELATLTPALARASGAAPSESTFLGRMESNAQKLVRVSPIDAPAGDDPAAVIARINAAAARDDITGALADMAKLPDPARALAAPWSKKAQAREAAIAAARRIAADALAALNRPASQ